MRDYQRRWEWFFVLRTTPFDNRFYDRTIVNSFHVHEDFWKFLPRKVRVRRHAHFLKHLSDFESSLCHVAQLF
jgi:hypothetical protein